MRRHPALVVVLAAVLDLSAGPAASVDAQQSRRALNVCHAGSLLAAFTDVEQEFSRQHPDVAITDTSGGSLDLARRFAVGMLACDIYAPADRVAIDALLKPARLADYTIVFAKGRMV